jgi:hypothetical protein
MRSRIGSARTALAVVAIALTATTMTTTAATTATAPSTTHAPVASGRAAPVTVHVTVTESGFTRSRTGFRPGNTVFELTAEDSRAIVQLLRLRRGYSLREFREDFAAETLPAIRRINRKVVFYGGVFVNPRHDSSFGVRLDAGKYHLIDFDDPSRAVGLRVEGEPERRSLPRATGVVDMVTKHDEHHRFQTPKRLPRSGWLMQTNRTDEPHFMFMAMVRESTTRQQVREALAADGTEDPPWLLKFNPGLSVISPGRTAVWQYDFSPGKYLELCFYPSDENGIPHALMGMFNFTHLR